MGGEEEDAEVHKKGGGEVEEREGEERNEGTGRGGDSGEIGSPLLTMYEQGMVELTKSHLLPMETDRANDEVRERARREEELKEVLKKEMESFKKNHGSGTAAHPCTTDKEMDGASGGMDVERGIEDLLSSDHPPDLQVMHQYLELMYSETAERAHQNASRGVEKEEGLEEGLEEEEEEEEENGEEEEDLRKSRVLKLARGLSKIYGREEVMMMIEEVQEMSDKKGLMSQLSQSHDSHVSEETIGNEAGASGSMNVPDSGEGDDGSAVVWEGMEEQLDKVALEYEMSKGGTHGSGVLEEADTLCEGAKFMLKEEEEEEEGEEGEEEGLEDREKVRERLQMEIDEGIHGGMFDQMKTPMKKITVEHHGYIEDPEEANEKIKSLELQLQFVHDQHMETLRLLYDEVDSLKAKTQDLTFQLLMKSRSQSRSQSRPSSRISDAAQSWNDLSHRSSSPMKRAESRGSHKALSGALPEASQRESSVKSKPKSSTPGRSSSARNSSKGSGSTNEATAPNSEAATASDRPLSSGSHFASNSADEEKTKQLCSDMENYRKKKIRSVNSGSNNTKDKQKKAQKSEDNKAVVPYNSKAESEDNTGGANSQTKESQPHIFKAEQYVKIIRRLQNINDNAQRENAKLRAQLRTIFNNELVRTTASGPIASGGGVDPLIVHNAQQDMGGLITEAAAHENNAGMAMKQSHSLAQNVGFGQARRFFQSTVDHAQRHHHEYVSVDQRHPLLKHTEGTSSQAPPGSLQQQHPSALPPIPLTDPSYNNVDREKEMQLEWYSSAAPDGYAGGVGPEGGGGIETSTTGITHLNEALIHNPYHNLPSLIQVQAPVTMVKGTLPTYKKAQLEMAEALKGGPKHFHAVQKKVEERLDASREEEKYSHGNDKHDNEAEKLKGNALVKGYTNFQLPALKTNMGSKAVQRIRRTQQLQRYRLGRQFI
eukprot:Nk52_evm72s208 gene=Nk52_evmTU72s208